MRTYVVLWANNPGLHPGDDFAPLNVEAHPGCIFWYQEYVPEAAVQVKPGTIPDYWVRFGGVQPDGSWQGWKRGGSLVEATNTEDLQTKVSGMQWGEPHQSQE